MTVREVLVEKADEYELRARAHEERAGLGGSQEAQAAVGFAAVAIALREIVEALDEAEVE